MNTPDSGESLFPFSEQPTTEIGRGVEFRVLKHGDGWVVKEGIHPTANTFEQLLSDKKDYELISKYIPDFIPKTTHLRGHTSTGKAGNIIRQREIVGKPLFELTNEELANNIVRNQLTVLFTGCKQMWEQEGCIPDLYGPENQGLKVYNPRFARNIIVEEGTNKVWLVDTSANRLAFSKEAALRYKIPLTLLRHNMDKFLVKLSR